MKNWIIAIGAILVPTLFFAALAAAWVTHVIACIAMQAWVILIVGALLAPIGIIHGFAIWFGVL